MKGLYSMTEKELKGLHKHSIFNEEEIKKSTVCGCFYCGTVLNVKDIDDFRTEKNGLKTAWCPICGIDAVIGDACGVLINKNLLIEMNNYFF